MTAPSTTSSAAATGTAPLAWGVLVTALLEVTAPLITLNGPGASPAEGSGPELLITPAGWAFAIWGVIYAAAIAQAVAVLVRGAETMPRRLQVAQIVLYLGGTLWIAVAALDSSLATAATLALMAAAALVAVLTVAAAPIRPRWLRLLTRGAVGLYAGWVSAALFLNIATALVDADAFAADAVGWQLVVLGIATLALTAVLVATRGLLAYLAAGLWALLGIAVTGAGDGRSEVTATAIAGTVLLVGATLVTRALREHRGR